MFWLAQIPVAGPYPTNVLPGLVVMALGIGCVFVGVQNAANAGVPFQQAGLAAALITTSSTLGAALGLATVTAFAANRTQHLLATHSPTANALTGGFRDGLAVCGIFLLLATVASARATSTREARTPESDVLPLVPEPVGTPQSDAVGELGTGGLFTQMKGLDRNRTYPRTLDNASGSQRGLPRRRSTSRRAQFGGFLNREGARLFSGLG